MIKLFFCISQFLFISIFLPTSLKALDMLMDTVRIEEVVVTGSPVKINLNYVAMSVSVVTSAQINENSESALLPILSGRIPGLFVTERGVTGFGVSAGSAGQITIRGIGGSPTTGVLMLIDGPTVYGNYGTSATRFLCCFGCGTGRSYPGLRLCIVWIKCYGRGHQPDH